MKDEYGNYLMLPAGYRWATEAEVEHVAAGRDIAAAINVRVGGDDSGLRTDLAVPVTGHDRRALNL